MNRDVHAYLQQVVRRSGLTRKEQREWVEEMSVHIQMTSHHLEEKGTNEEEATTLALLAFGDPATLRRKIAKDMFGLPLRSILTLASFFFALFVVDVSSLVISVNERTATPYAFSIPGILQAGARSPSLMIVLSLCSLGLLLTRRHKERVALFGQLIVFGLAWMMMHLMPLSYFGRLGHGLASFLIPLSPAPVVLLGSFLLYLLWGLSLYMWTGNRWLAICPMILSAVVATWSPVTWYVAEGTLPRGEPLAAISVASISALLVLSAAIARQRRTT